MSSWWRPSSTAEEPEDRVRTRRQAATAAAENDASHTPDATATPREEEVIRGRDVSRLQTPQERIRNRSRGKTPPVSPAVPAPTDSNYFNFSNAPSTAASIMATEEDIRRAVSMALAQDRAERDRQVEVATRAAVAAALSNQTSQVNALRKPDLPPFDKDNIQIWIKRLENAYERCNVTTSKAKFAFLESKFDTKSDPRINSFLYGDQTDDEWNAFLEYLREKHGRTRRQEVLTVLQGTPRDGRRPSALLDLIKERAGETKMDDMFKELVLKEMPSDVRKHVRSQIEGLTASETAKVCDKHFDQQGKLLESETPSTVHHVANSLKPPQHPQKPTFTAPFPQETDADPEVNAVRFKAGQRQQFSISNRSSSAARGRGGNYNLNSSDRSNSSSGRYANGANTGSSSSSSSSSNERSKKVCTYHVNYGKDAQRCEGSWCLLHTSSSLPPKGQASQ